MYTTNRVQGGVVRLQHEAQQPAVGWHNCLMDRGVVDRCGYVTERLGVRPWHDVPIAEGSDLASEVASILTPITTAALPESWHGDFTVEQAMAWIGERDAESPTLLVTELETGQVVGLVILAEVAIVGGGSELRIGYVIAEPEWGHGYGTELVRGLVEWARTQPLVRMLSGGVDVTNIASICVLEKAGFRSDGATDNTTVTYCLDVSNEWDQYATGWDDDPTARAYSVAAFKNLVELAGASKVSLNGAKVLDFGCGTGLLTEHLVAAGASVDAVDTSQAMLDVVVSKADRQNWAKVRASTKLPVDSAPYDLVVCSSVCSFVEDYQATVEELVSLLAPGGLFVQWDWERTDDDDHGLSRSQICHTLGGVGLGDVDVRTAFCVDTNGESLSPLIGHGQRPGN